ncbi:nickel/cobalt efflux transporter [Polycladidibacter stylochi]|uniref:nickel/cobalt efflux transporter n=1 Tax=Polycladidibacter stylochi TaxID=1807766 RepID=UPI0009E81201|nr:nickel/cobalt efflux transporter [Pseudovibrio stylochi]
MDITAAISAGTNNPLLLFVMALVLGALHGLEPGHSKTMMAAYIIAIRGSAFQATLLGISAATSHVIIVWLLAIIGLQYGEEYIGEDLEPILMSASGIIILAVGLWVLWQATKTNKEAGANAHKPHVHGDAPHNHSHHHDTHHTDDHVHSHAHMDAHALAHAKEIETRLESGGTSTWQTILFGLSGGLIPCPAAITVLLLCLQLKKMALGLTLVTAFSIGLAATLVIVGVIAALGIRFAAHRAPWLDSALQKAPLLSAILICLLGLIMIFSGAHHHHI